MDNQTKAAFINHQEQLDAIEQQVLTIKEMIHILDDRITFLEAWYKQVQKNIQKQLEGCMKNRPWDGQTSSSADDENS